jgi:phosphomannomutase
MADRGRTLSELVDELSDDVGPHEYDRVDLHLDRAAAHRFVNQVGRNKLRNLAGLKVTSVDDLDGVKLLFGDQAWLLVRASGTENLLRIYAEAPSREQVRALLDEMAATARRHSAQKRS